MDNNERLAGVEVILAVLYFFLIMGGLVGIFYSISEMQYWLLFVILGIVFTIVIFYIVYKFYAILKAIYNKLDSFDIPIKPVIKSRVSSTNESSDQKKEESVVEQPIEEKTDDSELADWKEKSIRGIKAGIANGKIDEERGGELIRRVQAATQIPEPKK